MSKRIDTLNGGLNDTIKAVAEELEIKAFTLEESSSNCTQSKSTDNRQRSR